MGFLKLPQAAFVLTSLMFIACGARLKGATLSSKVAQRGDGALLGHVFKIEESKGNQAEE
jgi:hypothetical protein